MCPQAGFPGSVEVVNVIYEERGKWSFKIDRVDRGFLGQNKSSQKTRKSF